MASSAQCTTYAEDDVPEISRPNNEHTTLLGSGQIRSPPSEDEEDEDHAREVSLWKGFPWWRRPSPYWLVVATLLSSAGSAALYAPKVAMYTSLACRVHRPGYFTNDPSSHSFVYPLTHSPVSINAALEPIPPVFDGSGTTSKDTSSSNYTHDDRNSEQKCSSDPVVQAVVAKLNAVFATSMGILSCLTAGWWGSLSDRYGRRIVLFVSVFGLFVTEFTHVVTAWFVDVLPGGYWFPLVGFLFEGLCGSASSGVAISHSYLADTTDPSTRSRYFSLLLGLMYTGVAVGPALGGLLIRSTGTILSVFYFACALHGVYVILILLILPESLTRARARGSRLRWRQEKANRVPSSRALDILKSIAGFFRPLVVLLPNQSDVNPLKRRRRDWNLFFVVVAYGLFMSSFGAFSYKIQYAAAQFNLTPETTSYYVSIIGAARAIFLAAILPLIIKYFKPVVVQLPSTLNEPLRGTIGLSSSRGASSLHRRSSPALRSPAFDLALARTSLVLEGQSFLGMATAGTFTLFTLAGVVDSLAAGFSPTAHALALDFYTNRCSQNQGEVGKLFGALSVIQALGSQIISPALYGFVYSNTVASFPQAILILSMCTLLLAFAFLLFVGIPPGLTGDRALQANGNGH